MRRLRILVVEDEPIVAMCLEDILENLGHQTVGPAIRLPDGVALAETEAVDAAFLDINLGGERSTPVAEILQLRGIPFVFASGYGARPDGFDNSVPLVEKPYQDSDIAAALTALGF